MSRTFPISILAGILLLAGCQASGDRFDALMQLSREGRDTQTLRLAEEILADPQTPTMVQARTEMTVALAHIRSHRWAEARAAVERAKALGVASDPGYFGDHLAEYESWIKD